MLRFSCTALGVSCSSCVALNVTCRPYLQACLFDGGLQDNLVSVRKALKDSALSSAFVRHAPAEMAVLEPIEDHPDRCATQLRSARATE